MHTRIAVGLILACCVPLLARAQDTPPAGFAGIDELVQEIRLLRQAVTWQGSISARADLLMVRLTLQDQRTSRVRQKAEWSERELEHLDRQRIHLQTMGQEFARSLEQATDQDEVLKLERHLRTNRADLKELRMRRSRLETRLAQQREQLDVELGRYDELERWLTDVDRELQTRDSSEPSNERMQQSKRRVELVPTPLGVVNVRLAGESGRLDGLDGIGASLDEHPSVSQHSPVATAAADAQERSSLDEPFLRS